MRASDRDLRHLTFPAQYLETVESLSRDKQQDLAPFYRDCGIDLTRPALPWQTINGRQMQAVLRHILSLCPAGAPPLVTFMAHCPLTVHGPVGMLAITSANLDEALQGALQYASLVMPAFRMRREDLKDEVHLIVDRGPDFGDVQDFFTETVVMAFSRIAPFLIRPVSDLVVHLRHAPLGDPAQYEAGFACKFVFNAQQDKMVLPRHEFSIALVAPSRASNLLMKAALDQQSLAHVDAKPVIQEVRRQLQRALRAHQLLEADDLANAMAMSPRTLSRRLKAEGSTVPQLRAEVGVAYAEVLLLDTDKTIAQIAKLAGFADAATFSRAFKRIKGESPSQRRLSTVQSGTDPDSQAPD